jgi:hypothetical protein
VAAEWVIVMRRLGTIVTTGEHMLGGVLTASPVLAQGRLE